MSNLRLENDNDYLPVCPGCKTRVCPPEDSGKLVDGVYWCGECLLKQKDDEIARLTKALQEYGIHKMGCHGHVDGPCDCGLEKVLEGGGD